MLLDCWLSVLFLLRQQEHDTHTHSQRKRERRRNKCLCAAASLARPRQREHLPLASGVCPRKFVAFLDANQKARLQVRTKNLYEFIFLLKLLLFDCCCYSRVATLI